MDEIPAATAAAAAATAAASMLPATDYSFACNHSDRKCPYHNPVDSDEVPDP